MTSRRAALTCTLLPLALVVACNPTTVATPQQPTSPATATWSAVPLPSPTPAPRRPITIALGGDVHFEGVVRQRLLANPNTAFGPIASTLRAADLAIVNLETAVTERGKPANKAYLFRAPKSAFTALRAAGIDVVSNANNHGMDFGQVGLTDTLAAAKAARFPVVGSGVNEQAALKPYRKTIGGWRVSVIGATQVLDSALAESWTATPTQAGLASAYRVEPLLAAVRQARATSDTVVVYLHWGREMATCPIERQRTLAGQLVDAGADIIVGGHAHVVQGSGMKGKAFVGYGLGNFLFYARGGETARTSVLTVTVAGRDIIKSVRTPAVITNGRPLPLTGKAAVRERARQDALRSCTGLR